MFVDGDDAIGVDVDAARHDDAEVGVAPGVGVQR